jgi:pimeloyl-ACP methyl ester carboxylesterase
VIAVVGAFCDRNSFSAPAKLTRHFTVFTYDRRGRGASTDTPPYRPDREVEDLAAVIGAAGGTAFVYGHSSGAALAFRAAAAGLPIRALAAYEAPFIVDGTRERPDPDLERRVRDLPGAGEKGRAVELFLSQVAYVPEDIIALMRNSPMWAGMEALAHTLHTDIAVCRDQSLPTGELGKITVPVLVLGGANSPEWFRRTVEATANAIPDGRLDYLDGQEHTASPSVLAPVLAEFFLSQSESW